MQLKKRKVLVVDDSAEVLETVARGFRWRGFETIAAGNGFDALKEVEKSIAGGDHFGLLLLDYAMPEMDGLTLAIRIRQLELERNVSPAARPRLVFFTAHDDLGLSAQVQSDLGVAGTYSKNDLVRMMRELTGQEL